VYQCAESSLHILNVLVIIFLNCLSKQSIYLLDILVFNCDMDYYLYKFRIFYF